MNKLNDFAISNTLLDKIKEILPFDSIILELGSGEGTGALADYYEMYSIEDDKRFINLYDSSYCHAPIKMYLDPLHQWYDRKIVEKFIQGISYDLFLIDAPIGAKYGREGVMHNIDLFENHIKQTGIPIIVDDTHRVEEQQISAFMQKHFNYDCQVIESENKKADILYKKL